MKKLFLLLFLSIISCSKSDNNDVVNEKLFDYISKNAYEPSSYQFVETKIIDTAYVNEYAEALLFLNNQEIKSIKSDLLKNTSSLKEIKESDNPDLAKQIQGKIDYDKNYIKNIEETNKAIEHQVTNKSVAYYNIMHKCKLKNADGQMEDEVLYFITDKDFNVEIAKDKSFNFLTKSNELFKTRYIKKIN